MVRKANIGLKSHLSSYKRRVNYDETLGVRNLGYVAKSAQKTAFYHLRRAILSLLAGYSRDKHLKLEKELSFGERPVQNREMESSRY